MTRVVPPVGRDFNPRTPCGVRPAAGFFAFAGGGISIHAPLAGCDEAYVYACAMHKISIHAPLAGCDTSAG